MQAMRLKRARGSPAVMGSSRRPVALRPRLSTGLPLSLTQSVSVLPESVKRRIEA
jgi:hypothetical protein